MNNLNITNCLKFDNFIHSYTDSSEKRIKCLNRYVTDIKDCLSKGIPIKKEMIDQYNKCVSIDTMLKNIDNTLGFNTTNKYTLLKREAIKKGRTLHYYCEYPEDKEFTDVISDIIKENNL